MHFEGRQLGRYQLHSLIGRGGTSDVYLAEDQRMRRQVALKIIQQENLLSEDAKDAARLFEREARTIARLNHPHILPLFDFAEETIDGVRISYLVTPYCPEGSLLAWLHRRGAKVLSADQVIPLIQQAADALAYAHDNGVVHRDVKPSNFLVRSLIVAPDRPHLLLADFGIARFLHGTLNLSYTVRGTASHMSPEQWRGEAVPATDQYALAIMAYQLLAGQPPFQGTQQQVMYHHCMTPPPPPSMVNQAVSPALDAVILRGLEKQPEARFASIADFAHALRQAVQIDQQPYKATSPPVPSQPVSASTSDPVVQLSAQAGEKETQDISTPPLTRINEIHTVLNISITDANEGAERSLQLPNGQLVTITVPSGAYDGQQFRMEKYIEASSPYAPKRDLVVHLAVASGIEPPIIESLPGFRPSLFQPRILFPVGLSLILIVASIVGIFSFRGATTFNDATQATAVASKATFQVLNATFSAATATAIAQVTATAQLTATAPVTYDPYDSSLKTLTLYDALNKNSAAKWDEVGSSCTFKQDGYHAVSAGQLMQVCIAHGVDFKSVAFEVQMTLLGGIGGGILLYVSSPTTYYFRISQDGNYALLACTGTGTSCNRTLTSGFSSWITSGRGQSNLLAVVAKGDGIQLYVNNQRIDDINTFTSLHGQIGVVADTYSEVVFRNAKVWTM